MWTSGNCRTVGKEYICLRGEKMGISLANLDVGGLFGGIGQLAKDLRTAFTGKEPIDATKAAELALKVQELEFEVERARTNIIIAEASSLDKWTSRARPSFMYVFYFVILVLVFLAPLVGIFKPIWMTTFYANVALGFQAIPDAMWATFSVGYIGYTAARQYGKVKGSDK
jgi:hypothetical protein